MTKLLLFIAIISMSAPAVAFNAKCKAVEVVDSSILKKSLSVEEYPEVVVSDVEASLGNAVYKAETGCMFEILPTVGFKKAMQITNASGDVSFTLIVNNLPNNKTGTLLGQIAGQEQSVIAELVCD